MVDKFYYIRPDPLNYSVRIAVGNSVRNYLWNKVAALDSIKNWRDSDCEQMGNELNNIADEIIDMLERDIKEYYKKLLLSKVAANVGNLSEDNFHVVPADIRFPGFINSLADHMITVSAFAISAGMSINIDPNDLNEEEYKEVKECFKCAKFKKGFIRVAALLHDIGKPPADEHANRTKEFITLHFGKIGKALAEASSRHHYGRYYQQKHHELVPRNKIEWLIAFADKASSASRSYVPRMPGEKNDARESLHKIIKFFRDVLEKSGLNYDIGKDNIEQIDKVLNKESQEQSEEDNPEDILKGFLDKDPNKAYTVAKKLDEAEKILSNQEKLLSLISIEVPSIQSYLMRGNSLKTFAGYSLMIDYVIHAIAKVVEEMIGKEVILSKEDGRLLALFPAKINIKQVLNSLPQEVKEILDSGLTLKYHQMPFRFIEAYLGPDKFRNSWNNIDPVLRDSIRGFGLLLEEFFNEIATKGEFYGNLDQEDTFDINQQCKECRISKRINAEEKGDPELCNLCNLTDQIYKEYRSIIFTLMSREKLDGFKFNKLLDLRPVKLIKEILELQLEKNKNNGPESLENIIDIPLTLDDFKKQGKEYIAFISGDGDSFGLIKSSATTLTQYLALTRAMNYFIYYGVMGGIINAVKENEYKTLYISPFYIGGDDIFLAIEGDAFMSFFEGFSNTLRGFYCEGNSSDLFEKLKTGPLNGGILISMSSGVYVTKDEKMPIFLVRSITNRLEKLAKKKSKSFNGKHFITYAVSSDKFYPLYASFTDTEYIYGINNKKSLKEFYNTIYGVNPEKIAMYVSYKGRELNISYDMIRREEGKDKAKALLELLLMERQSKSENKYYSMPILYYILVKAKALKVK